MSLSFTMPHQTHDEVRRLSVLRGELLNWREMMLSERTGSIGLEGQSPEGKAWLDRMECRKILRTVNSALPIDCMVSILSYLPKRDAVCQVSLVSRKWKAAAFHPLLWNGFNICELVDQSGLPYADNSIFLAPRMPLRERKEQFWLRRLLEGRFQTNVLGLQTLRVYQKDLSRILTALSSVKSIDLSHAIELNDDCMTVLGKNINPSTLMELKLNFCCLFSSSALLEMLHNIQSHSLMYLHLSGCDQLEESDFGYAMSACCALTELFCNNTSFGSVSLNVAAGQRAGPWKLRKLFAANCGRILDDGLTVLVEHADAIETLDISKAFSITDSGMSSFLEKMRSSSLSNLRIEGCVKLGDSLLKIPVMLPRLTSLNLDRTNVAGEVIHQCLRRLCHLEERGLSANGCLYLRRDVASRSELRSLISTKRILVSLTTLSFLEVVRKPKSK